MHFHPTRIHPPNNSYIHTPTSPPTHTHIPTPKPPSSSHAHTYPSTHIKAHARAALRTRASPCPDSAPDGWLADANVCFRLSARAPYPSSGAPACHLRRDSSRHASGGFLQRLLQAVGQRAVPFLRGPCVPPAQAQHTQTCTHTHTHTHTHTCTHTHTHVHKHPTGAPVFHLCKHSTRAHVHEHALLQVLEHAPSAGAYASPPL